jgi:tRNA-dihydrouridine synthase
MADASSSVPVSVKCRIGVHERLPADGSLPEDRYETLATFVETVAASGAVG